MYSDHQIVNKMHELLGGLRAELELNTLTTDEYHTVKRIHDHLEHILWGGNE